MKIQIPAKVVQPFIVLTALLAAGNAHADHHLVVQLPVLQEARQLEVTQVVSQPQAVEASAAAARDTVTNAAPVLQPSAVFRSQSYVNTVGRANVGKTNSTLPSQRTYKALRDLSVKNQDKVKTVRRPIVNRPVVTESEAVSANGVVAMPVVSDNETQIIRQVKYQTVQVSRDNLAEADRSKYSFQADNKAAVPLTVADTLLLKLDPRASQQQIEALLEKYDFTFIEAFETLGTIKVAADLSEFFQLRISDNDNNQMLLRGIMDIIKKYQQDPLILSVSPDSLLSEKNITNLLSPSDIVVNANGDLSENSDWGVEDIEADHLWSLDGASDGVLFGVLDVGFNRHEDLVFIDIPTGQDSDNHGNHVAGIACGKHNGVGIRGVLPNCFVRPRSADHVPVVNEGGNVSLFLTEFSQVLASLNNFITEFDDVSAYNISLGYNWISNFGINSDDDAASDFRVMVQMQGEMLVSVYEILNDRGVLVFSAAGNDSTGLDTPINAKFASPFNYAAIVARERGINNGVIVEAHDREGNRAPFSNTGGHISCPGVDIVSTIAQLDDGVTSTSRTYATMSGTSMASPYCASAAVLLKLVTDATPAEIVDCMTTTGPASSSGAPRLKLDSAREACQG